jgi:AraC-like DNA-binding protein
MMQMLMSGLRVRADHRALVEAVFRGDLRLCLRVGQTLLEARPAMEQATQATLGQLLSRALLVMGRAEDAEELFQRQLHRYASLPREQARWLTSLDRGAMNIHLRRMARAATHFNEVADDGAAPVFLRLEALVGLALAFNSLGEFRHAQGALRLADTLAAPLNDPLVTRVLLFVQLDLRATQALRSFHWGLSEARAATSAFPAAAELAAAADALAAVPLCQQRLRLLAVLHPESLKQATVGEARAYVRQALAGMQEAQQRALEEATRIDAGIAFISTDHHACAQEWLGTLWADEARLHHHADAVELMWCQSQLLSAQGLHADALCRYRQYTQQAVFRLRSELTSLPHPHFLEGSDAAGQVDPFELKLPIRYRSAYRYIMDNLGARALSVNHAAAHIDVTVRALQLTFRLHLGMTPAELIRRRRMEAIRAELVQGAGRHSVLDVATRWGMNSRSTLTQNYRQHFGEAPSNTLRSGAASPLQPAT